MNDEHTMDVAPEKTSFGELLKQFFGKLPKVGEIVEGTVISVDKGAVRIDVGGLTTGVVRGKELFSESKEYANIKSGDTVQATMVEQENENGEMELSFRIAGQQLVWDRLRKAMTEGLTVGSKIISANKGGLMLQIEGVVAFMPVSQLSPEHYPRVSGGDKNRIFEKLREFIGQTFQVKIIDVNQKEEKLIISEKAVWEDDQKAVLEAYKIGDIIDGEVGAITSFGAFLKFGDGLEGLVHISEIAWQRIDHPKDVLKIGDKVKAQIIDLNKSKIYFSMKRLVDDPWKSVKTKYTVGQVVEGEVHKVEAFGLMVKLDNEIHGLAHISELSDSMLTDKQLREMFVVGGKYNFEIMSIEPAEHRLGLKREGVSGKRQHTKDVEVNAESGQAKEEEKVVEDVVVAEAPAKVEEESEEPEIKEKGEVSKKV